jgi:hypothetical protein
LALALLLLLLLAEVLGHPDVGARGGEGPTFQEEQSNLGGSFYSVRESELVLKYMNELWIYDRFVIGTK